MAKDCAEFICVGPQQKKLAEDIFPIMKDGLEILHVHTGDGLYEVYAKLGGLLYSGGDIVELVSKKDTEAIIRNPVNDKNLVVFSIPLELFQQDFIPYN